MAIIIKNGSVVGPAKTIKCDVKIVGEKIVELGEIAPSPNDRVVDAEGKYILPGLIDAHTHLDLDTGTAKSVDDFASGTKAAIAGGTTTIIDFATQEKGGSLKKAVEEWNKKADNKAFCDYGFHMAMVDWNDSVKAEMKEMVKAGIPSFKLYMAYKGALQVDDGVIFEALEQSTEIGGLIGFHCENGDLVAAMTKKLLGEGKTSPYYHPRSRPDILEEEAIFRLCETAKLANAPVWVVHLSSLKGLSIIEKMKADGVEIITETCPQYLVLEDSKYGTKTDKSFEGAKYVISPPLRKKADIVAMWRGISESTIDFISTDHCSFDFKGQKELGKNDFSKIPNGASGLENRLDLVYNFGVEGGKITLNDLVRLLAWKPSKVFGLTDKGSIEVGKDADIVIFDPKLKWKISAVNQVQKADYTPYEGINLKGKVEKVLLRGTEVYRDGVFVTEEPTGKFQKRSRYQ